MDSAFPQMLFQKVARLRCFLPTCSHNRNLTRPAASSCIVMHCPQFRLQLSTSSSRLAQRRRLLLTGNLFGFSLVVATRSQHVKEMYGSIASSPPILRLLFPLCNQLLPSQFLSVLLFQVDYVRPFSRYDFVQTF